MTIRVSLIATVLNEYGSLPGWLEALARQSLQPDEIVIVDGGSTDGTWELLQGLIPVYNLPLIPIQAPGASISGGRNLAMNRAHGDLIAIADAGTRPSPTWLETLVKPFDDDRIDVVGGFFIGDRSTFWNRTLSATTLPDRDEIDPVTFLPSSRSFAIRRRWFEAGFQYPEWLDYCEDLILDLQLKHAGARFDWQPDAVVTFEPRRSWSSFFKQYYRYARGDGKAGLFAKRHAVRYGSYLGLLAVISRRRPLELMMTALLGAVYMRKPTERLIRSTRADRRPLSIIALGLPMMTCQRFVGDIAKMIGYPTGLLWRARRYGRIGLGGS